ncbi:MAG TPA: Hsp20/alpha crystallin family protein [Myxococcales bacterium]|nr:Hsp20/alpha crystallin family protein [Myxococcales bacterium]
MADLIRFAPARTELRRLQNDMDNWFSTLWNWGPEEMARSPWPKTDIYEDAEGLKLAFEVPGLDPKDVKVTLADSTLTVSGERKLENEEKKENYHRIERTYGAFERSFSLPGNLDTEKVHADYKSGVLQIFVPRSEKAKPRTVSVKVESK